MARALVNKQGEELIHYSELYHGLYHNHTYPLQVEQVKMVLVPSNRCSLVQINAIHNIEASILDIELSFLHTVFGDNIPWNNILQVYYICGNVHPTGLNLGTVPLDNDDGYEMYLYYTK